MQRLILGLTGPPGAGKSTLAGELARASDVPAAVVAMDGFHLADAVLDRHRLRERKGAPQTFDPAGYAALLHRLRTEPGPVFAPGFDRDLEQPLAGAIEIGPEVRLVVTEGNYLLLDEPAWHPVTAAVGRIWYLESDEEVRRTRLMRRHVAFGKSEAAARDWVARVDEPNAALVRATRTRADRVVPGDADPSVLARDLSRWARAEGLRSGRD